MDPPGLRTHPPELFIHPRWGNRFGIAAKSLRVLLLTSFVRAVCLEHLDGPITFMRGVNMAVQLRSSIVLYLVYLRRGSISAESQHPAHKKINGISPQLPNHDWKPFNLI